MAIELEVGFPQTHVVSSPPTTPPTHSPAIGQIRLQIGPNGRSVLWQWSGSEWQGRGLTPIIGSGNPQGIVPSDCIYQEFWDSGNACKSYFATSNTIGATSWQPQNVSTGS
jgi:hypothetical protein